VILIDTNIFMYAAGKESPQRLPCQRFLERIVDGEGPAACTDTGIEEVLSYDGGFSEVSWAKRCES
jgi:predicted nucleic acid-binding protein